MKAGKRTTPRSENGTAKGIERREVLQRFGTYAAYTAPAMMVLLSSRQGRAGSFFRKGGDDGDGGSGALGFSA